jgi:hypothetical protein
VLLPLAMSHSFIVLSSLPEAKVVPLGLKARANTPWVWPLSVSRNLGSWADSGEADANPTQASQNIRFTAHLPLQLCPLLSMVNTNSIAQSARRTESSHLFRPAEG